MCAMKLPSPIEAYFDADRRGDGEALLGCFRPDAVVTDEGRVYAGRPAIETWWRAAKAKYKHQAEPLDASGNDGGDTVRARVTGDFPGSPADLTFAFRHKDGLIAALEIGA
jgi:ketosteroid isomerase-like protein